MGVTCTDVFTCYATTIIGSPDQFDNGDPGGIVGNHRPRRHLGGPVGPSEDRTDNRHYMPRGTKSVCYAVGNGNDDIGALILKAVFQ